jgi:hypothetical protein
MQSSLVGDVDLLGMCSKFERIKEIFSVLISKEKFKLEA